MSLDAVTDYARLAARRTRRKLVFSLVAIVLGIGAVGFLAAAGYLALLLVLSPVWAALLTGVLLLVLAGIAAALSGPTEADRLAEAAMVRSAYGRPGAAMPGAMPGGVPPMGGVPPGGVWPGASPLPPGAAADPFAALISSFLAGLRAGRRG